MYEEMMILLIYRRWSGGLLGFLDVVGSVGSVGNLGAIVAYGGHQTKKIPA